MDPTLEEMESMARDALAGLPAPFRGPAAEVALQVADWPRREMLREVGIDDPLELTGLYDGIPMTEKSLADPAPSPDVIWLFREPILAEWHSREGVALEALVAHVVVHELAHHFGWSDEDIAEIDEWWL
jgi:predicted Zn-dependent protease with MMP-like domain